MIDETRPIRITVTGTYRAIDNTGVKTIICPSCGASQGLTFTALVRDRTSAASCPRGHSWQEPLVDGRQVRDSYARCIGEPTKYVHTEMRP